MSHCIYCNSTTYGRPCIFSPTNTHVHFDAPHKCIYCGSKVLGSGCIYNPFGKNHIRGPEFLANMKEHTEKSAILSYLYENLINENENRFLTPLGRFYKRLFGIITNTSQPLLEALGLQSKISTSSLPKEYVLRVHEIKERLIEQYKEINATIRHANLSLPKEIVEEVIVDAIISSSEKE